jgi:hypothetical protein
MSDVIRSRGGRRPVGAKGINCRVCESIFDREVKNLYRGSDSLVNDQPLDAMEAMREKVWRVEGVMIDKLYKIDTEIDEMIGR